MILHGEPEISQRDGDARGDDVQDDKDQEEDEVKCVGRVSPDCAVYVE